MDAISFDTHTRTAAYRNGWDNCEPDSDDTGRLLSSTAHEGLLHVLHEGDLFCIIPTYQPILSVSLEELAAALRTLSETDTAPKGCPPLRTERLQMVAARTAQHLYRAALEQLWEGKCALTSLQVPELLRASHAKPWKDSTDAERTDPCNGFLLEVRLDALFDQGFISFSDEGALLISPTLSGDDIRLLHLDPACHLRFISPRHLPYLHWHREHVYRTTA